jgi:hypothetical protein
VNLSERQLRYKAIEDYRKRPLIVYATSTRPGTRSQMGGDAVREFIDQVDAITDGDAIDVLIHSNGGDALAAWKLMAILRERFKNIAVLVPSAAFSAATIFALGAEKIFMHPHASLGPIDPQVQVRLPDGVVKQFAYEDLGSFIQFLREEVQLTEQAHLTTVVDKLFANTDPVLVGAAKRASNLSAEVGERLLSMHMTDERKAHQIAQNLAKSFFAHGDAVSRSRARKLDLQVCEPNRDLESLIWNAYLGLEAYMELRTPFNPLGIFMSDSKAAESLSPIAPVSLPPDTPPQLAQNVWTQIANRAITTSPGVQVPCTNINAVIESTRVASEWKMSGSISASRLPTGDFRVNIVESGTGGWKQVFHKQNQQLEAGDSL